MYSLLVNCLTGFTLYTKTATKQRQPTPTRARRANAQAHRRVESQNLKPKNQKSRGGGVKKIRFPFAPRPPKNTYVFN